MSMRHHRLAIIAIAILIVALVVVGSISLIAVRLDRFYLQNGSVNIAKAQNYWGFILRLAGPSITQVEFEREGALLSPQNAHLLAHSFGAALYGVYGDDGFQWCTSAFAYGCYHELSGLAIAHEGYTALGTFVASCGKLPENDRFGCMHGLGHGIVAATGYTLRIF